MYVYEGLFLIWREYLVYLRRELVLLSCLLFKKLFKRRSTNELAQIYNFTRRETDPDL